ncbi:MAG: polysaccharide biosynthesis C-terminal domain-containing protein [Candidatus Pacebacteria bacterium]|nr:polysaccharide biosynthesis C-terminal domain-containing protein [Candidatus Paceibacterota bacterium]
MQILIFTLVTRGLLFLSGILSSILTARLLSPADRGVFFYWSVIAGLFFQFGNLGFPVSNIYLYGKNKAGMLPLFVNSVYITLVSSAIIAVIIWLSFHFSTIDTILMAAFVLLSIYYLFTQNLLVAQESFLLYNFLDLANRLLSIILLGVLVYYYQNPTAGYVAMVAALMSVTLAASIDIWRRIGHEFTTQQRPLRFDFGIFKTGFRFSILTYATLVLSFGFIKFNVFFLKHYFSPHEIGIWSIAVQIFETLTILPVTLGFLIYPKLIKSKDPHRLLWKQIKIVSVLILLAFIPIIGLGEWIIVTLYGLDYAESYQILLYSLPAIFCISVITILSQYISAMGLPWQQVGNWVVGILVQVVGIMIVQDHYGLEGFMIALSVSSLVLLLLMWRLSTKIRQGSRLPEKVAADINLGIETMNQG